MGMHALAQPFDTDSLHVVTVPDSSIISLRSVKKSQVVLSYAATLRRCVRAFHQIPGLADQSSP